MIIYLSLSFLNGPSSQINITNSSNIIKNNISYSRSNVEVKSFERGVGLEGFTLIISTSVADNLLNADLLQKSSVISISANICNDFGEINLFGKIDNYDLQNGLITITISDKKTIKESIISSMSFSCKTSFCSSECGLNSSNYTSNGVVTSVVNDSSFIDALRIENFDVFAFGKITFTSGLNKGLTFWIKNFSQFTIELMQKPPFTICSGDTYQIMQGCDKSFSTCSSRFLNGINFRGEFS